MRKIIFILAIFGLIIGSFAFAQMTGKEKDIMSEMPQPQFVNLTEGMVLTGAVKVEIKVEGANSVEFYLRRPESLQEIYLGKAISPKENFWEYSWDITKTPNGDYYLFPKITNQYGQYSDLGIFIGVNNEIQKNIEEEAIISQQIQQIEQMSQSQTQETQTVTQSISQESQNLTKEGMQLLKEEEKKMVETQVSQKLEESSTAIAENIRQLTEKIKEEVKGPPEEKEKIIKEKEGIEKEILEEVLTPVRLIEEKLKEEAKPLISEIKERAEREIESQLEELEAKIKESEKARIEIIERLLKDSDNDGLPDHEEIRLGTNPFNPDTDGDGFLDGIEYKVGYDPLKPGSADKIVYQDPRKVEPKEAEIYKVERVKMITLPTGELGIKFEGKGRPYSFVTLYIHSPLLVLTTKTDGNGYWEYILDKPLEEGHHEIYVTVTNNGGEITARSETFSFLVKPGAVAVIRPPVKEVVSPAEILQRAFIFLTFAIVILAIGFALIIIGILAKKAKKEIEIKG